VKINILYPKHAEALETANLNPTSYPTLKQLLDAKEKKAKATDEEKEEKQKDQSWLRRDPPCSTLTTAQVRKL
jgi:hypothetical protein